MLLFVWFLFELIAATSSNFVETIPTFPCQNNITCGHGEPHNMCVTHPPKCQPFQQLKLGPTEINYFLLGHNGLRNRVAMQYNIANMNIVHWSTQLQMRAARFLRSCRLESDSCQNVGPPKTHVNHNFHYHHSIIHHEWPAHLVRKWYNEFNYRQKWENFNKKRKRGLISNYSHLIYPAVQLIGCNAAKISDGALFTCYYWPRTPKKYMEGFAYGMPCSKCNPQLPACSRVFHGLCGIDLQSSRAKRLMKNLQVQAVVSLTLSSILQYLV